MNNQQSFLLGLLSGAALMYLLDPSRGARRRALIRDQVVHGAHELDDVRETAGSLARHVRNRARGAVAETRARFRHEPVDDVVLEARVRSELGRLVSDPGEIRVTVDGGLVTLAGSALPAELEKVLSGVEGVAGVREVVSRLAVRERAETTPNAQGTPSDATGPHEEPGGKP